MTEDMLSSLNKVISSCIHCPADDRNVSFFMVEPPLCIHTTFPSSVILLLGTWVGSVTAIVNGTAADMGTQVSL